MTTQIRRGYCQFYQWSNIDIFEITLWRYLKSDFAIYLSNHKAFCTLSDFELQNNRRLSRMNISTNFYFFFQTHIFIHWSNPSETEYLPPTIISLSYMKIRTILFYSITFICYSFPRYLESANSTVFLEINTGKHLSSFYYSAAFISHIY